jgi:hypothetical protein
MAGIFDPPEFNTRAFFGSPFKERSGLFKVMVGLQCHDREVIPVLAELVERCVRVPVTLLEV